MTSQENPLYFLTGNSNKAREVAQILGSAIERVELDVPEIQSLDSEEIIRQKLEAALKLHEPPLLVEDTSFVVEALGKLPGPLIKWFEQEIGDDGLYYLIKDKNNRRAYAHVTLGLALSQDDIHYFEGVLSGTIVAPRGSNGFGFDVIFMPDGHDRTLAEMSADEKNAISHRRLAFDALRQFLETLPKR